MASAFLLPYCSEEARDGFHAGNAMPSQVRTVVLLSSAPGELQVCLRDSVIYIHGVIKHFICNGLVCFLEPEVTFLEPEMVNGKPILLLSCSEPVMYLVIYITEHSESRGSKFSDIVIAQDIYPDINMHDGYTLEY